MLLEKEISANDGQQRVDRYVKKLCPQLSLSRIHFLFRKKEIKIDGKPVPKNFILSATQKLQVYGLKQEEIGAKEKSSWDQKSAPKFPYKIIYEDDHIAAVEKPPGISVHPGTDTREGNSLIEKYLQSYPPDSGEIFKPALVHRLDKDTSGVLLIAKSGEGLRYWTRQWREQKVDKKYYALTQGIPKKNTGTIENTLQRVNRKFGGSKSVSGDGEGKKAVTRYTISETRKNFALVEVQILTGRLHQIRTHFSELGTPILGDNRYGDFSKNREAKTSYGLRRIFLHCFEISGTHLDGKRLKITSPLPDDLHRCWDALGP